MKFFRFFTASLVIMSFIVVVGCASAPPSQPEPVRNVSMKVRQIRFAFSDSRMSRSFAVVGLGHAGGVAALQAG
jgi:hypothetical protein